MYLEKSKILEVLNLFKENFNNKLYISFDYFSEALVNKETGIVEADEMINRFKSKGTPMITGLKI